jgi:hypothetical protein
MKSCRGRRLAIKEEFRIDADASVPSVRFKYPMLHMSVNVACAHSSKILTL